MTYTITVEKHPKAQDLQLLSNGIMAYAKEQRGFNPLEFFAIFFRDEKQQIQGGCNGNTLYGCLYIDQLWVAEALRHKGWGKQLIDAAECWGKEHHCRFATVNTMDWEALRFYQMLGYQIEFERHGFDKRSIFYFLTKDLSA